MTDSLALWSSFQVSGADAAKVVGREKRRWCFTVAVFLGGSSIIGVGISNFSSKPPFTEAVLLWQLLTVSDVSDRVTSSSSIRVFVGARCSLLLLLLLLLGLVEEEVEVEELCSPSEPAAVGSLTRGSLGKGESVPESAAGILCFFDFIKCCCCC